MAPPKKRALRPKPGLVERARKILDLLDATYPGADCALHYKNPFQLAVATILSAQCTDERVNKVTPALFKRFASPKALAAADPAEVEDLIRTTGFFRAKTRSVMGCARALVANHGGKLPTQMETLVKLPGFGRKTANVVLGHAFKINEGIAVDTHVLRLSNRLGLAKGEDPIAVEQQLMAIVPRERWTKTTDLLISHGRALCLARRPFCGRCPVFALCAFPEKQAWALKPETSARGAAGQR